MSNINRIVLSPGDFAEAQRELIKNEIYHVGGASSLWVPQGRKKIMLSTHTRKWPDKEGEVVMMTSGEAARTELQREFPDIERVGWKRGHIKHFDWRPPIYFSRPVDGSLVYIDLVAAYWSIYRQFWLEMPFPRGFGRLSLRPVADRLEIWKSARNAVMGVIRSRVTYGIRGTKRVTLRVRNPYLAPALWASVQAVLHDIAYVAWDVGAVYFNTDGYIFRRGRGDEVFKEFLDEYGLEYHEISGYGDIRGWNSYMVGSRETGLYKVGLQGGQKEVSNVRSKEGSGTFISHWSRCRDITRRGGLAGQAHLPKTHAGQ